MVERLKEEQLKGKDAHRLLSWLRVVVGGEEGRAFAGPSFCVDKLVLVEPPTAWKEPLNWLASFPKRASTASTVSTALAAH